MEGVGQTEPGAAVGDDWAGVGVGGGAGGEQQAAEHPGLGAGDAVGGVRGLPVRAQEGVMTQGCSDGLRGENFLPYCSLLTSALLITVDRDSGEDVTAVCCSTASIPSRTWQS